MFLLERGYVSWRQLLRPLRAVWTIWAVATMGGASIFAWRSTFTMRAVGLMLFDLSLLFIGQDRRESNVHVGLQLRELVLLLCGHVQRIDNEVGHHLTGFRRRSTWSAMLARSTMLSRTTMFAGTATLRSFARTFLITGLTLLTAPSSVIAASEFPASVLAVTFAWWTTTCLIIAPLASWLLTS